ncbi:MAG: hypothetical protein ACXAAH_00430 [Promethearchaeota archaeon]|jgi:tRNA(Ile)-lysidine synthase TilS/MesJ
MIFHDSIFDGHHMMDWGFGQWFGMIFGGIFIFLAAIIILYFVIHGIRDNSENVQETSQEIRKKNDEAKLYKSEKENFEEQKFCHACGVKLESRLIEYCPNCGTKI